MAKNFLWITRTEENLAFYADSAPKSNLSLHFASNVDAHTKKSICSFVRYLRKERTIMKKYRMMNLLNWVMI